MIQVPTFLSQFGPGLESDNPLNQGSSTGTTALTNLETTLSTIIGALTVVGGILFVVYFLLAGVNWVTAGGDSGKVQKARDQIIQGVLGLILLVAAYGLIGVIGSVFGLDLLRPAETLNNLIPRTT